MADSTAAGESDSPNETLSYLPAVCGDVPFWNSSESWNTEDPDFSTCFRRSVFIWIPCAAFWLFLPWALFVIYRSTSRSIPLRSLGITKILLTMFLIVIALIDLVYFAIGDSQVVDILDPAIRTVTFFGVLGLIMLERKRGMRVSPLQWVFWLVYFLASIPNAYSHIRELAVEAIPDIFPYATFLITFILVIASFVLHFFVEPEPLYSETKEEQQADENPCPLESSSFPSIISFTYFDKMAWTGFKRALTTQDLWDLPHYLTSRVVVKRFRKHWDRAMAQRHAHTPHTNGAAFNKSNDDVEVKTSQPAKAKEVGVFPALIKAFGCAFLSGSVLKLAHDLLIFVSPMLLKTLMGFAQGQEELWKGVFYALVLLLTVSCQTFLLSTYFFKMYVIGMYVKASLISAIYRKSLTVSTVVKKETTTGEVVNLMSVDVQRLVDLMPYMNMLWSSPLQIGLALFFLWQILGPSSLAGLLVMILLIPVNGYIAMKAKGFQVKQMKQKDQRVKMMNEILQGIKILKLYAWEPSFEDLVRSIRGKEIRILTQMGYLQAGTSFIWTCAPYLVALVSFAAYVLSDPNNVLDAQKAFVSISLFNILRFPLSMLPMMITMLVQASVSLKRMNKFLNSDELDQSTVDRRDDSDSTTAVSVNDASFKWEAEAEEQTLKKVNVDIEKGALIAIVGPVGAGKSSFLSAVLGEMEKTGGSLYTNGAIAYSSQQAWIQNDTLKNNVLFGQKINPCRYNTMIDACALRPDLQILSNGDETEIGEKGINLSGGQKQRVSLARMCYSNADIFLMDDPLSAVDSHVGKHIFENVIGPNGVLKGKTRILVTHSVTYLPIVDRIIVLKDGEISEMGTYKELLANKGAFAEFLVQYLSEEAEEEDTVEGLEDIRQQIEKTIGGEEFAKKLARCRSESERERTLSGGSGHKSATGSISGSRNSLDRQASRDTSPQKALRRRQSSQPNEPAPPPAKEEAQKNMKQYQDEKSETGSVSWVVYAYYVKHMGLVLFFLCIGFSVIFQICSAASNIWLARWGDSAAARNDTATRDMYLGVYGGLGIGQALAAIGGSLFLFLSTLRGARLLHNKMLHNVFRSPMSFFDTTPQGRILNRFGKDVDVLDATMPMILRGWLQCLLAVISTFLIITYATPIFLAPMTVVLGGYYIVQRIYVASSRQLKRLESVSRSPIYSHFGETINGATTIRAYGLEKQFILDSERKVDENQKALFPSVVANRWLAVRLETVGNIIIFSAALLAVLGRDHLTPGIIGLSISYALQVTQTLNWLVRMSSEVETNIVAAERMKEYSESRTEADWTVETTNPPEDWPAKGNIEFVGYSTRYREGLDLILKQISVEITGGERVGIVGRTGAGKSSLTLALFRIIEPAEGKIVIDGIDISSLGLHQLRNKLTIIPQDPVLFSGSLRMNLDPFNNYLDDQVWTALEHSHLKSFVSNLKDGLNHEIAEGGENLSVGQRQLICLARALLRKTKVLVLDEATAAVDLETDELIQATIRKEFSDCTIITIAHRLNTVLDYDKILVLDKGEKREYDSPQKLLDNRKSIFYGMCKDAGLV